MEGNFNNEIIKNVNGKQRTEVFNSLHNRHTRKFNKLKEEFLFLAKDVTNNNIDDKYFDSITEQMQIYIKDIEMLINQSSFQNDQHKNIYDIQVKKLNYILDCIKNKDYNKKVMLWINR